MISLSMDCKLQHQFHMNNFLAQLDTLLTKGNHYVSPEKVNTLV